VTLPPKHSLSPASSLPFPCPSVTHQICLTILAPATHLNVLQARFPARKVTHNDAVLHAHGNGALAATTGFAFCAEWVAGFVEAGIYGSGEEYGQEDGEEHCGGVIHPLVLVEAIVDLELSFEVEPRCCGGGKETGSVVEDIYLLLEGASVDVELEAVRMRLKHTSQVKEVEAVDKSHKATDRARGSTLQT
jgi:hypothetical protein